MNLNMNIAIAALLASHGVGPNFPRGRVLSPVQERMHAKREADAPRRAALAGEIAEWNSKVKRRNRRFVARQLARGRSAR